ncbi:hypothetical protein CEXT_506491 [Caerostris extrusa]|uniref:Uncharacterized protein n=1 Tax=Caerostris extrusa TaxID=172846 RepID=A0AAV4QPZ4_CAEEX|nr:hypothetical protein CEXT_506491 [Caerostris extrusa]
MRPNHRIPLYPKSPGTRSGVFDLEVRIPDVLGPTTSCNTWEKLGAELGQLSKLECLLEMVGGNGFTVINRKYCMIKKKFALRRVSPLQLFLFCSTSALLLCE